MFLFSFEGEKNILFIFDLIVIISCYYIHKVKWNVKIPTFEHFKIDVNVYLETIPKSKNLKAIKTNYLNSCLTNTSFFVKRLSVAYFIYLLSLFFSSLPLTFMVMYSCM